MEKYVPKEIINGVAIHKTASVYQTAPGGVVNFDLGRDDNDQYDVWISISQQEFLRLINREDINKPRKITKKGMILLGCMALMYFLLFLKYIMQ